MNTAALRDAMATAAHGCLEYIDRGTPREIADAILALPEMVAAMGVVEAARALDIDAMKPAEAKWYREPWAELFALGVMLKAYDAAVPR